MLVKSKNFDKGYRAEFDNIKSDILLEKSKDEKVFIKKCDQFDLMKINFVIAVDYNMIVSENDTIQYVFYILLLFMIPLLGIVL